MPIILLNTKIKLSKQPCVMNVLRMILRQNIDTRLWSVLLIFF